MEYVPRRQHTVCIKTSLLNQLAIPCPQLKPRNAPSLFLSIISISRIPCHQAKFPVLFLNAWAKHMREPIILSDGFHTYHTVHVTQWRVPPFPHPPPLFGRVGESLQCVPPVSSVLRGLIPRAHASHSTPAPAHLGWITLLLTTLMIHNHK